MRRRRRITARNIQKQQQKTRQRLQRRFFSGKSDTGWIGLGRRRGSGAVPDGGSVVGGVCSSRNPGGFWSTGFNGFSAAISSSVGRFWSMLTLTN
ncbi:hypothetical protein DY000_02044167 [Brassica cretica]|uniref:Uncharacterized protein n=1 Tax=Brassica cretica TaxID=69181 RepID=A0ABQ7ESW1_BRACR|nr:hypothetical protein DY000_02044167 [Brassica cretica]